MADELDYEIDWYIAFADTDVFHPWDVVTCKDFRHCFAFRWDGYNWILVDYIGSWLEVQVMPYYHEDDVPDIMLAKGFKIVYVRKHRRDKFILRGLMTCVSVMKHLLGIRSWWVITPKQLYNYLKRKGYGKII
jgi:hypothetical protein